MIGIQRGYNGLLNGECFEMNLRSVSNIISAGGTILLYGAAALSSRPKKARTRALKSAASLASTHWSSSGGDGLTAAPVSWHTAASR